METSNLGTLNSATNIETSLLNELKDSDDYCSNAYDKGVISSRTGASLLIRRNGDINISPSLLSQIKSTSKGYNSKQSIEDDTICVRDRIETDEILINEHKLNNTLYDLTDFKELWGDENYAIGNLTMYGTVLVKAWEPTLKKWVLIRRKVRMPIFSNTINNADAPEELSVDSSISQEIESIKSNEGEGDEGNE